MTRRRHKSRSVLRSALHDDSPLQASVCEGLGAVKAAHHGYFEEAIRTAFDDSLDLDEALRAGNEQEHRWDYLLGHASSSEVVAVEPHSAKQDEVSTVIRKKAAAQQHLRSHLRNGARVGRWLWVSSGKVQFADTEKTKRRLDENGIQFVGTRVMAKHLNATSSAGTTSNRRRSRRSR